MNARVRIKTTQKNVADQDGELKPHIGKIIKSEMKRKGRKVSWFAEQLNCHRNNIYLIYSRSWIDTETLFRISQILEYNFFAYLSDFFSENMSKDVSQK